MKKKRMKIITLLIGFVMILCVVGCSKSTEPDNELKAPTSLTALIVNGVIIQLEWVDNCSNEEGFKIERRSENGQFEIIADLSENVTIYIDNDINFNEIYIYRVCAYTQNNQSDYSNEVSSEITYNGFKIIASDGAENDSFGYSVSIHGDYAVVGAPYDDDNGGYSGSAYIFYRDGGSWIEQEKLLASNGAFSDYFGCSVAIEEDYVYIGASCHGPGAVYIFERVGTNWIQQQIVTSSDGEDSDRFGSSLSVYDEYLIVGAPEDENNNLHDSGSAYIFHKDGSNWSQQQKLTASDAAATDWYGGSVAINSNYAFVGATQGNAPDGTSTGSVYVYSRDGNNWSEIQELIPSDGSGGDRFGCSISVFNNSCLIGASAYESYSCSAYIFILDDLNWTEHNIFTGGHHFGCSVCINNDYSIVGANPQFGSGSASLYKKVGIDWTEFSTFVRPDPESGDDFGCSVSIEGDYAIIGAKGDDDNGNNSGSVYIYNLQERFNFPAIHKKNKQLSNTQNEISLK